MAKKYHVQFFSRKPRPRDEGLIFEALIPARSAEQARERFKRYFSKEFELYLISAADGCKLGGESLQVMNPAT